jgi:NDP-sugar pyrophosphorylase family protein
VIRPFKGPAPSSATAGTLFPVDRLKALSQLLSLARSFPRKQMLPVAILAGGLAKRMRPLTESVPKSLLPVNGKPFIAHQLRLLQAQGITEVVLCTGFLGEQIVDYVGDGRAFGMQIKYSNDGDEPLGTAGAIRKALPLLPQSLFVLYGDSYLTCAFAAVEKAFLDSKKIGLMTVYANHGFYDRSNVEFVDGAIRRYDKRAATPEMRHIDYGLGVFRAEAFERCQGNALDLEQVYQDLLNQGQLAAFEVHERFYEIGSFSGLRELDELLARNRAEWTGETCHPAPR